MSRSSASAKRPMIRSISRMPRCQDRNRSLRRRTSSPSLERVRSCRSPGPRGSQICINAKSPDGPGARLYSDRRATGYVRWSMSAVQACIASRAHTRQHRGHRMRMPNAAARPQSAVRGAHEPARRRAEAGEALPPPARPRRDGRASSTCCSTCRPARSTAARGRNCATWCPDTVVTVAVTVDRHRPPPPHRPRAPYRIYTSDETGDLILTFFNARRDYLEKLLPVGERRYVSARPRSTTACCRWCIPTAWSTRPDLAKLPLVEPVYPLTEGLSLNQVRKAVDAALAAPAGPAGMAGPELGRARALSALRRGAAQRCTGRPSRPTCCRRARAWTRLAYDELLAGQLALALVRAHLRRPAGRVDARHRAPAQEADRGAALLAHAVADARGRRHRRRSRQARAHAAAAAGRRRLRQDRGGAARRRDRDRRRPAGRADGADRNPGAPAFQHHRAARRRGRHRRRHPDRPRARPRAQRACSSGSRSATSIC